ncbi:adenosine deaminase/editase [Mycena floridula]|nr:adenosine deaminase/editase [Mycena floridula]
MELDSIINSIFDLYSSTKFVPPHGQYTVLASFFLIRASDFKVISIGTGTKCLPAVKLSMRGEAVNDSHAEILARRAAIYWLFQEVTGRTSEWITVNDQGMYMLQEGVTLNLYISTPPCGDASMRFLAAFQDPNMAQLKNSTIYAPLDVSAESARGRDNYSLFGVLRTKPGRADSPPTLSMSCSDKIASWSFLGIQGALASRLFAPVYLHRIIIGEVPLDLQGEVTEDCERALWGRLQGTEGHEYQLHRPEISFTSLNFMHARSSRSPGASSCNESLSLIADSNPLHEVLINGLKRGVSPKHRYRDKSRPRVSKLSLFQLFHAVAEHDTAYWDAKQLAGGYQAAKQVLRGEGGIFSGWRGNSSSRQERFNRAGEAGEPELEPSRI